MTTKAKTGDVVKVHYTGKLDDGTVFDSSIEREPIQYKIGDGQLIADFENAAVGMEINETKTITIPAENAYGPRLDERIIPVSLSQVPPDMELKVGDTIEVGTRDGQRLLVKVVGLDDENVILDMNHALAGEDLTFEITLVEGVETA
ncbi:MAG: peptidylprolyl isomerase [Planctomycetes bacterium]|jgi:peptidylprolyl isomerase|nr:peptidylprolyl isomerase [Planctomycetota bacterium]